MADEKTVMEKAELIARFRSWIESEEGQRQLREGQERAEKAARRLRNAEQFPPHLLQIVIDR